jgi:soluble cytochrome b562
VDISRLSLLRKVFRSWRAKLLTGGAVFVAFYQFACDQFGFPTLPNLWGMSGASIIPWWAWLLLAQLGALYGLFEYVRCLDVQPLTAPTAPSPPPEVTAADKKKNALETLAALRVTVKNVLGPFHDGEDHERVFHALEAAMLTISHLFGVKLLMFSREGMDYRDALETYAAYIDRFYPMLVQGHLSAAKAKAADFKRERNI